MMTLTAEQRAEVAQVTVAVTEDAEVYWRNADARESNRLIRDRNYEIERQLEATEDMGERRELRAQLRDVPTMPHRVSTESLQLMLREAARRAVLAQVSPWEWKQRIDALPAFLRAPTANIIWWDKFSLRVSSDRWEDLNDYLFQRFEDFPPETLAAALIACGYTPYDAVKRTVLKATDYSAMKLRAQERAA